MAEEKFTRLNPAEAIFTGLNGTLDELANDLKIIRERNPEGNSNSVLNDLSRWDDMEDRISSEFPQLDSTAIDTVVEYSLDLNQNDIQLDSGARVPTSETRTR